MTQTQNFKSITNNLKGTKVSPEFWRKQSENMLNVIAERKKMKESMKMSPEKFR